MSAKPENPFERFDLDPKEGSRGITERLRELAEEAGETERAAIREAWEELTLHPLRRLRAALTAFPVHEEASSSTAAAAPLGARRPARREPLTLAELAPRPLVAFPLRSALVVPPQAKTSKAETLDDDPVLAFRPSSVTNATPNPPTEKKR